MAVQVLIDEFDYYINLPEDEFKLWVEKARISRNASGNRIKIVFWFFILPSFDFWFVISQLAILKP